MGPDGTVRERARRKKHGEGKTTCLLGAFLTDSSARIAHITVTNNYVPPAPVPQLLLALITWVKPKPSAADVVVLTDAYEATSLEVEATSLEDIGGVSTDSDENSLFCSLVRESKAFCFTSERK